MNSVAITFKKSAARADMKPMRFNNRERFAILLGVAWWLVLAYYAGSALWHWLT